MCQQIHSQISQSEASLFLGLIQQTILQAVPEIYFKCTSGFLILQLLSIVIYKLIYKWNSQVKVYKVNVQVIYKCI